MYVLRLRAFALILTVARESGLNLASLPVIQGLDYLQ